jgi:hypothetical protein
VKAAAGAGPDAATPDQASAPAAEEAKRGKKGEPVADLSEVAKTIGSAIGKAVSAVKGVAPAAKKSAPAKPAKKAPPKKSAGKKAPVKTSKKKGPPRKAAAKKKK